MKKATPNQCLDVIFVDTQLKTWENSTSINMFCSLGLNTEESFNRHRDAKYILSNIDPIESPDHSKKLIIGEKDETCLDKNVALLHSDEC